MKRIPVLLLAVTALTVAAAAQGGAKNTPATPPAAQPTPTLAATIDRQVSGIEKYILEVAEAMPEEKYNFSPEGLNISGSDYKGVRSFAGELKHIAASNYYLWTPVTGDKLAGRPGRG